MKRVTICLLFAMCVAAAAPAPKITALLASKHRPDPQVRNVNYPRRGLVCGEVTWISPSGRYGGWFPFHIIDGRAEVGEFYPEIWNKAPFPGQVDFERAHRACAKTTMPPPRLERRAVLVTTFPHQMLDRRWSGWVRVILTVGTNGRVVTCKVTKSSGHLALDARTCRTFILQARFKPAADKTGKAVQADVVGMIHWELSREGSRRSEQL